MQRTTAITRLRRVEFPCESGELPHSSAWLGYSAVWNGFDGDYMNNTAHAVVYIRIGSLEALEAILFVSLEAPQMTTTRIRSEHSSAWVSRRLSRISILESTVDRSNSTDDASGSCTDNASGSALA